MAVLDPVADKLMVAAALIVLVQWNPTISMAFAAIVIISREITVSALREWMAELGARTSVAVSTVGKYKTAFQMIAISVLTQLAAFRNACLCFVIYGGHFNFMVNVYLPQSSLALFKAALSAY